ncbi:uncharacterized protein LOC131229577 isoform X2 [Magnolia sinica]|uniref:uncharacterized protein LOC131229577 isoform X2 n=1 Tax=Magnolia sinica TaxID=86752 RepID=UPI00265A86EF|nr:uncharacterized protein LOC131229577 isoform X2 [Magnolia sinica]
MHGDGRGEISSCEFPHGETPSRYELLSMVRKHSNWLGKIENEEQDATDVEMDSRFWNEVLDLYFICGRESKGRQDDDLIFFVRNTNLHGYGFNDNMEGIPPYFVRSIQALRRHQNDADTPLSPIYKVVKTVYASPSRVDFQLDSRKASETLPAYPNICFAIDDFDSTFDAVVLTETDHCFCVILNAHDGAAFPTEKAADDGSSSKNSSLRVDTDSGRAKLSKLTLFSGFVSYQMVREAYDAGKSRFGSLLSIGHSSPKTDRLYMRGPGGRGEVEVAVSGIAGLGLSTSTGALGEGASAEDLDNEGDWVLVEKGSKKGLFSIFVDQSEQDSGPPSPLQISKKGLGIGLGTIVRKAASAASLAAKHAYAAAAATRRSDEDMLPLKCCLMSISLPWEHIAHDLLFKGSPPVNL